MAKLKKPGVVGIPDNTKEAGKRVDFRPDDYDLAIETKGYRLAWSRASVCPCKPVNDQTEQPNPNCTICKGTGWLEFTPRGAVTNPKVIGKLTSLQQKVVDDTKGAVVMGLLTSIAAHDTPYDQAMRRIEGMVNITTRPENKLGYNDRLVNLDAKIVYSQILTDKGQGFKTRYPIVEVNYLASETTTYAEETDFNIVDGAISWIGSSPAATDRLAIHYLTYPYWRIVEHPHMTRQTLLKQKIAKPSLPQGDPKDLPVMAVAKLEFVL